MSVSPFWNRARIKTQIAFLAALAPYWLFGLPMASVIAEADVFTAGGYSFSDELGGFRLASISGTGTSVDPVILEEEIFGTGPATLVIRRIIPRESEDSRRWADNWRALTLIKVVRNRTKRIWVGFELELQEELHKPSVYSDGLSFNQIGAAAPDVASDDFAGNIRLFEPYDRIRFSNGHVNPESTVRIRVQITDPTPEDTFYLLQDPQILFASLRPSRRYVP